MHVFRVCVCVSFPHPLVGGEGGSPTEEFQEEEKVGGVGVASSACDPTTQSQDGGSEGRQTKGRRRSRSFGKCIPLQKCVSKRGVCVCVFQRCQLFFLPKLCSFTAEPNAVKKLSETTRPKEDKGESMSGPMAVRFRSPCSHCDVHTLLYCPWPRPPEPSVSSAYQSHLLCHSDKSQSVHSMEASLPAFSWCALLFFRRTREGFCC